MQLSTVAALSVRFFFPKSPGVEKLVQVKFKLKNLLTTI